MFKNIQQYDQAQERIIELLQLQKRLGDIRLSLDDQLELDTLLKSSQVYMDNLDMHALLEFERIAEQSVYDNMMEFEERFHSV